MANIDGALSLFQSLKKDFTRMKLDNQGLSLRNRDLSKDLESNDAHEQALLTENTNLKCVVEGLQKYQTQVRELSEENRKLKRKIDEWQSVQDKSEQRLQQEISGLEAELRKVRGEFGTRKENLEKRLRDTMMKNTDLEKKVREGQAEKQKLQNQLKDLSVMTEKELEQTRHMYESRLREAQKQLAAVRVAASPKNKAQTSMQRKSGLSEEEYEIRIKQLEQALVQAQAKPKNPDSALSKRNAPFFSGPPSQKVRRVHFKD